MKLWQASLVLALLAAEPAAAQWYDRRENRWDRREGYRDHRYSYGPAERWENRWDRRETRWDRRDYGRYPYYGGGYYRPGYGRYPYYGGGYYGGDYAPRPIYAYPPAPGYPAYGYAYRPACAWTGASWVLVTPDGVFVRGC
jgi:hypothetical protein